MGGKKPAGENTKKASGNARKAEAAAQRKADEDARKGAVDDEEWGKGAKSTAKKDAAEAKKAEAARKKAEKEALLAAEEKSMKAAKTGSAKSAAKKPRTSGGGGGTLDLSQLDADDDDDNDSSSRKQTTLVASGIDNALDALSLATNTANDKIDRHPERRYKAAYAIYEAQRLPEIEVEMKGLRRQQRIDIVRKEFEKHPDNPFNQANAKFDATKGELEQLRTAERRKIEERLAGE
ncbi:MAG: carnitine transporter [Watsoniomyces obsoletus]|nr:MAG: carnitine transporter [Watsoniomyces obsoletus]